MKTLYVPKGKTLHYERLECQTIIADGTLVVDGAVRAKRITGKGLLDAGSVYSPAVSVRDLDTVKVVCDLLAAEYVQAVEVIVSSSAVVSRYLEAEYVEARKLTVSKHQISELRVEEFTYLPEKKRGVIGALLSGFFRRLWLSVRHRTPINAPYKQSSPNAKEESGMKGAGNVIPTKTDHALYNNALLRFNRDTFSRRHKKMEAYNFGCGSPTPAHMVLYIGSGPFSHSISHRFNPTARLGHTAAQNCRARSSRHTYKLGKKA